MTNLLSILPQSLSYCFQRIDLINFQDIQNQNHLIKLQQMAYLLNFFIYAYGFLLYGFCITGMGTLLPYFSEDSGIAETDFSYIFFCRAIGYFLGGYLNPKIKKYINSHQLLFISQVLAGVFFILSGFSYNPLYLGTLIALASMCFCNINVQSNMCILRLYAKRDQQFWIQMLNVIFGMGGLFGPFLFMLFKEHTLVAIGVMFLIGSPLILFIHPPQHHAQVRRSQKTRPITTQIQILICVLFLLYIGVEVSFSSWLPSYLVINEVCSTQIATLSGTVFWVANTVFRVLFVFWKAKISEKLFWLQLWSAASVVFMIVSALFGYKFIAGFVGAFLFGVFMSSLYSLYLALPSQFNMRITQENGAHFIMSASLGEGTLTMPIGYSMGLFGSGIFFVQILFICVIMEISLMKAVRLLYEQQQRRSTVSISSSPKKPLIHH